MVNNDFAIIGGDFRSCYILYLLDQTKKRYVSTGLESLLLEGINYNSCELDEALKNSKNIILPLPAAKDKTYLNTPYYSKQISIKDLCDNVSTEHTVFGGMLTGEIKSILNNKSVRYYDYYVSEGIKLDNAVLTAEAALAIAINNTPKSIFGSKILVCGFGRIGKVLSRYVRDLGAIVDVLHEKEYEHNIIKSERMQPLQLYNVNSNEYSVIFNTVPKVILDKNFISKMNKNTLIIELASSPGGFDKNFARYIGCNVIESGSLPGKISPLSAAEIILSNITNYIKEDKSGG